MLDVTIERAAQELTLDEVADLAGGREEGLVIEAKRVWYLSCPSGEEEAFAEDVRQVVAFLDSPSASAAMVAAVRAFAALIRQAQANAPR